ncbi:MAG: glycosyltransferase [Azospirillaceae bacterium]
MTPPASPEPDGATAVGRSVGTAREGSHAMRDRATFDIIFVLPHMGEGGAQRVASLVINQWAEAGHRICLVTTLDNKPDAHRISDAVTRIRLGKGESPASWRAAPDATSRSPGKGTALGGSTRATRPRVARMRYLRRGVRVLITATAGPDKLVAVKRTARSTRQRIISSTVSSVNSGALTLNGLLRIMPRLPQELNFVPQRVERWRWRQLLALTGRRGETLHKCLDDLQAPVVLSFLTRTNIMTILATRGRTCRVVVSERNDPDLQELDPAWSKLRRLTYPAADLVTSNSVGILRKLERFAPKQKLALLPNPIILPTHRQASSERERRFVIAARLVHQKGLDVLIDAFAQAAPACAGWTLDILGAGPLREELEARAVRRQVADRVRFHGHVANTSDRFVTSRVFVLPSRFEGMPNALLEAMSCGMAPIVSDSSPGPLECVIDGETGLVTRTEDVADLASKMTLLANDDVLRIRLGEEAKHYIRRLEWSAVEALWLDILGTPFPATSGREIGAPEAREALSLR